MKSLLLATVLAISAFSVAHAGEPMRLANLVQMPITGTGGGGGGNTLSVIATDAIFESVGSCHPCTPFTKTVTSGDLVLISALEYNYNTTTAPSVTCGGSAASLITSDTSAGSGGTIGWIWHCPAVSGSTAIVGSKTSPSGISWSFFETRGSSSTPADDGFASGHSTALTSVATLGSPTTNAAGILYAACNGANSTTKQASGGGAGAWSQGTPTLDVGFYQIETTTSAFSVTCTLTGSPVDNLILIEALK